MLQLGSKHGLPARFPRAPTGTARRSRRLALAVTLALGAGGGGAHAAASEPGEHADMFLTSAALNGLVRGMTPLALEVRGDRATAAPPASLTLVEARYCGTVSRGEGRVLAIAVATTAAAGAGGAAPGARLAAESDCQAKPGDIANRPAGTDAGSEPLAVIEVLVGWAPSQLRFSIGEIATNGEGASLGQTLARARAAGPIATVDTAGLTVANGGGATQTFNLAVTFPAGRDGVWIAAVPARGRPPGREARSAPSDLTSLAADGGDAQVGATYPLANRLLAFLGQEGPLVLPLSGQSIEIREIQVGGAEGALTVRGKATSREVQETMRLTIDTAGSDLKVARVGAEPELESCAELSTFAALGCRARNAARTAAANATAAALTNRYRGERLRTLSATPPETSVELDGLRVDLRLTPTRIRATASAVVVAGKIEIEIEKPGPRP